MWSSVIIALSCALLSQAKNLSDPTKDEKWMNGHVWRPYVGSQFQIVLSESLDANQDHGPITPEYVEIFDIDLFDNSHETFARLKDAGKKIICYFSAGTSETWRPDFDRFKEADQGAALPSWPGERWLNTSSPDVLKLMRARIRYASRKGCDAIDPDNMDGYGNENGGGFVPPLSQRMTIKYVRQLARYARLYGMSTGLKNAMEVIPYTIRDIEFAVNEQCGEEEEACDQYDQMLTPKDGRPKPVFHIEYVERLPPSNNGSLSPLNGVMTPNRTVEVITAEWAKNLTSSEIRKKLCVTSKENIGPKMSTVIKVMKLDGWVMVCNGDVWTTRGIPIAHNPINYLNGTKGKGQAGHAEQTRVLYPRIPPGPRPPPIDPMYAEILEEDDGFDHVAEDAFIEAELAIDLKGVNFTSYQQPHEAPPAAPPIPRLLRRAGELSYRLLPVRRVLDRFR